MTSNTYRPCGVRECRNTSIKTPGKLWIIVPSVDTEMRNTWLKLAGRDPNKLSLKSPLYFCEDHFDLENDMENYMQYKIMGSVRTVRMKPKCVPSKFDCLDNPQPKITKPRKAYVKRQRTSNLRNNEYQDLLTGAEFCNLVYKVDKGVQASPVQEHKSAQILLKDLSDLRDLNTNGAKNPGMSSKNTNQETKNSSSERKETKVFCPKCKTEVPHTAEGILEDQTKALIAKVFHYFEEELELLKKMKAKLKLAHLSKFHQRAAQATGVSEATVLEILQEEARRKADKSCEQNVVTREVIQNAEVCHEPPQKRRRAHKNPSQKKRTNEYTDYNEVDVGQTGVFEQMKRGLNSKELILKDNPVAYDDKQAQTCQFSTEVKMEPYNDETNEKRMEEEPSTAEAPCDYPLSGELNDKQASVDPLSTAVKEEPDNEINEKRIEEESSTAEPPSDYQRSGKLDEGRQMKVGEVKVEKLEIAEEGFT